MTLRFENIVVVNLDAAYNLARWLTRDGRDAEDLVQDASLRALKFLDSFKGGNSRAWFLTIVRNTYYSEVKKRSQIQSVSFDEDDPQAGETPCGGWDWNESDDLWRGLESDEAKRLVGLALEQLPEEFREILILRELEELSYQDIARIAQIPLGTVMSRLSRARKLMIGAVKRIRQES